MVAHLVSLICPMARERCNVRVVDRGPTYSWKHNSISPNVVCAYLNGVEEQRFKDSAGSIRSIASSVTINAYAAGMLFC